MPRTLLTFLFLCFTSLLSAQSLSLADREEIMGIMAAQSDAWNQGDLKAFMKGYWENDSLVFIGSKGLTYGWDATLAYYQLRYPDRTAMGTLTFDILQLRPAGPGHAFMIGRWHLARTVGDLSGHFSLLWRKIEGKWVIVADHSS
jgi:ketosteroid isomerase-like protein